MHGPDVEPMLLLCGISLSNQLNLQRCQNRAIKFAIKNDKEYLICVETYLFCTKIVKYEIENNSYDFNVIILKRVR